MLIIAPMTHVRWSDIEQFHNHRKYYKEREGLAMGPITYRAKVKLHGTCAGLTRLEDGSLQASSREAILEGGVDNFGFSSWAKSHDWTSLPSGHTIFGEWCGPKIQKGVAISSIPNRIFAVFALQKPDCTRVQDPEELKGFIEGVSNAHVLPWYGEPIAFDWHDTEDALQRVVDELNARVEAVETCDPWVKETFGVEGIGEGLVFYPITGSSYAPLFKAKGEKHRVAKAPKAVQVDATVLAGVEAFVTMFVTETRLEQGIEKTGSVNTKNIGAFLKWFVGDVEKESKAELDASGMKFEQVSKAVMQRAREWYVAKTREL